MKSAKRGATTSQVEVSAISPHGIWLFLGDREVFLSFAHFPWFRDASVSAVMSVERPHSHHLYWPLLDVDLAVESIDHPELYPLISRERPESLGRHGGPTSRPAKKKAQSRGRAPR
jgi:hypothetical protein